jgi:hypothetical protein
MKTIYKYPIQIIDRQEIEIHSGAEIIKAGLDPKGNFCIWAIVSTESMTHKKPIWVVGTGNPFPRGATKHIDSFNVGPFVWHIFE